ncbi:DRAP deaminase [Pseudogymnoascus australis]
MAAPPAVVVTPADPWPRPYVFEDGLRRVAPYHFTYNTNCKMRWRGRELLDIFESEFRDRPVEYYKSAIENGNVVVNGKPALTTHVVQNGDVISHTLHRHEPPVTAAPITVISEDEDIMVICKPSGIPVHPAGRYNYNSVIEILAASRPGWKPLPCNRLDRLTSGVMFIGKHPRAAEELSSQISGRTVRKEYVARVAGKFPDGDVVCAMPILQISPKLGLNRVRASGKPARTVFRRLAYYGPEGEEEGAEGAGAEEGKTEGRPWVGKKGYSIVRCLPITGRTHQIRVHLQFLGHPITNDPIYSNQRVWGTSLGAGDADATQADEDIITRLARMGKSEVADAVAYHDEMVDEYNKRKAEKMSGELCEVCATPLYTDPGVQEMGIYLHSLRYEDKDLKWSYRSELPEWALPPGGVEGPRDVGGLDEVVDLGRLRELEEGEEEVGEGERKKEHERNMARRKGKKGGQGEREGGVPVETVKVPAVKVVGEVDAMPAPPAAAAAAPVVAAAVALASATGAVV